MNKRRLMAFYAFCRQNGTQSPDSIERAHNLFRSCERPHMNLNAEGVKILKELIDKFPSDDYSDIEKQEIEDMIHPPNPLWQT